MKAKQLLAILETNPDAELWVTTKQYREDNQRNPYYVEGMPQAVEGIKINTSLANDIIVLQGGAIHE